LCNQLQIPSTRRCSSCRRCTSHPRRPRGGRRTKNWPSFLDWNVGFPTSAPRSDCPEGGSSANIAHWRMHAHQRTAAFAAAYELTGAAHGTGFACPSQPERGDGPTAYFPWIDSTNNGRSRTASDEAGAHPRRTVRVAINRTREAAPCWHEPRAAARHRGAFAGFTDAWTLMRRRLNCRSRMGCSSLNMRRPSMRPLAQSGLCDGALLHHGGSRRWPRRARSSQMEGPSARRRMGQGARRGR
jgi:hypothetical protein